MTKREFADGVEQARNAFSLDPARPEVLAAWWGFLHEIETREWRRIVRRIILDEEGFPRNFVRCVLGYVAPKVQAAQVEPPVMSDDDQEAAREFFAGVRRIAAWTLAASPDEDARREELRRQAAAITAP